MEVNTLEKLLLEIRSVLNHYDDDKDDNETYYPALLHSLQVSSNSIVFDEAYGVNEELLAKLAIKHQPLHDIMRDIVKVLITIKDSAFPLMLDVDEFLYAGHYFVYELAYYNKEDLPLYADYIELLCVYESEAEPRFRQVPALIEKWGRDATLQIIENFKDEINEDGIPFEL